MGNKCINCGKVSFLTSKSISVCVDCIRNDYKSVESILEQVHIKSRYKFGLPSKPPRASNGVKCNICANECCIEEGQKGFCGLRENRAGKLHHLTLSADKAVVEWYYDALPTNCVADWVCAAGSQTGYPQYSYSKGVEYGYKNLAVFYGACSFDCLFCQNWHYRMMCSGRQLKTYSAEKLAAAVDEKTSCICYFGGDPSVQIIHALKTSELAKQITANRILRICWETNGYINTKYLDKMAELSLDSGGCIKFDIKAWNEPLHKALTGVSNKQTLANFKYLSKFTYQRPQPPFLIASTLLVPGYVDIKEIENIAEFIASLNPDIPYSLLAFHPQFYMSDLPTTSRIHAQQAYEIAKAKGLKKVKIGNIHLLSDLTYII